MQLPVPGPDGGPGLPRVRPGLGPWHVHVPVPAVDPPALLHQLRVRLHQQLQVSGVKTNDNFFTLLYSSLVQATALKD